MENQKKKFHINWVDVVIIVVVLAIAAAAVLIRNMMTGDDFGDTKYVMSFVAEAQNVTRETVDCIKVGDSIYNSSENTYIGKIVSKETKPHMHYEFSHELGKYIAAENPDTLDLYITIEGEGVVDTRRINIGAFQPAIGKTAYLKSKGYALVSYVVAVDTNDAPVPEDIYTGRGEVEIVYQMLVSDLREMSVKAYKVGERIYDKTTGALMGVVEMVESKPHVEYKVWEDEICAFEKEGKYDVILTLRAHATEKDYGYFLDDGIELKVGTATNVDNGQGVYIDSRYVSSSLKFHSIIEIIK